MTSHPHFKLSLRTPQEELFEGSATSIFFNAEDKGSTQVLPHHAAMTTTIQFSRVVISTADKEEIFFVRNGMFLFDNEHNRGVLLALHGERHSEISHQTAKEYLAFLEEQIKKGDDLSEFQVLYLSGEKLAVEEQLKTST